MSENFLTLDIYDNGFLKKNLYRISDFNNLLADLGELILDEEVKLKSLLVKQDLLAHLELSLINESEMKALNHQARGINQVTDVLSFPNFNFFVPSKHAKTEDCTREFQDYDLLDPHKEPRRVHLGEIVICPERTWEQARDLNHSFLREFCFLYMHSILHLAGYDHLTDAEEDEMFGLQKQILPKLEALIDKSALEIDSQLMEHNRSEGQKTEFRSGIVTIAGRTNAGKSTLINQILKTEIAIATHKPQTTRHLIKGIYDDFNSQIVFIDSPGMHKAADQLGHNMQKAASVAIQETDLALLVVDARDEKIGDIEKRIIQLASSSKIPLILVINKIDLIDKIKLLPIMQMYLEYAEFKALVPLSAKHDDGVALLIEEIKKSLPIGPPIVHDDSYTDQTERVLAAEFIRREIIVQTSHEIPYQIAVRIDEFEEIYNQSNERKRVKIHATIFCERNSHKMILLGKKGRQIAAIGKASRLKIAEMLDCPCDLMLFVKVAKDWRNKLSYLKDLGYSRQDLS